MAEYIKRETLVHRLKNPYLFNITQRIFEIISEIPAADVAPVVRCKDCNHYDMGVCLKIYSDGGVHPEAWQSRKPEDFCSYGERKDGGDG